MKILITGPHKSGKTSLAKQLAIELNLPYINNNLKRSDGLSLYPNLTLDSQIYIFLELYKREIMIDKGIFDRGLLDCLAYTNLLSRKNNSKRFRGDSLLLKVLENTTCECLTKFNLIIVKQPQNMDIDQKEILNYIITFLSKYKFKYLLEPKLEDIYAYFNKNKG